MSDKELKCNFRQERIIQEGYGPLKSMGNKMIDVYQEMKPKKIYVCLLKDPCECDGKENCVLFNKIR